MNIFTIIKLQRKRQQAILTDYDWSDESRDVLDES